MYRTRKSLTSEALAVLQPPPDLTVSQWADAERRLSPEASAAPGRWRTRVVEYMREPMDMIGNTRVRMVVVMAGSQVAKSEALLNAIGRTIHVDPAPILVLQPTLEMAEAFSKERIAPMLRDTPALQRRASDARSRSGDNTIKSKRFPGGTLTLVGANSPASLASRPIRDVYADEVDRYPLSAGTEGDPLSLAIKRTVTFWNRRIVLTSTPTVKGSSRIETAYLEGDQRQLWCPCPDCGTHQVLTWAQVHWIARDPQSAAYACEHCGSLWTDAQRVAAVRAGEWRAQRPWNGIVSYHIPGLLSPFSPLSDGVREFLDAQGHPERLQTWTNTFLGETWEDRGESTDPNSLRERAEDWGDELPEGVTVLTAGVDVQDDRVEVEVVGWGDDEESWSIDYRVIRGDPTAHAVWTELRQYLRTTWQHPMFGELAIRATCLDTGHHTQRCYEFARSTNRVFAVKGIGGEGKPIVGKPTKSNLAKINLFPVGTHEAKKLVMTRLQAAKGEAGYCNFPADRDIEYYRQLTAESLVKRFHRGFAKYEWKKDRSRNEAFDARVYATAALTLLSVDLRSQRRYAIQHSITQEPVSSDKPKSKPLRRPGGGFADAWREW